MNVYHKILALVLSIVIAYISLLYTSFAAMGIIVALPLFIFRPLRSFVAGFAISFVSSLSIYIIYPLSKVSQLALILGSISGIPSILVILLYPILFSLLTAFSGVLWSEIIPAISRRRKSGS